MYPYSIDLTGILLGLAGVLLGVALSSLLFRGRLATVRAERQATVQGLQERLEEGRAALVVKEAGQQQRGDHRDNHAVAGPDDAATRGDRRGHALETENEKQRGGEVARLDRDRQPVRQIGRAHV